MAWTLIEKVACEKVACWCLTMLAGSAWLACGRSNVEDAPPDSDAGRDIAEQADRAADDADAGDAVDAPVGRDQGTGQAVGRPCELGAIAGPSQGAYNVGSGECPGHVCLKPVVQQGASGTVDTVATCSAECAQDSDCEGELGDRANDLDHRCKKGFACGIPFAVGPLCCRKLCMCKDFLAPSGATTPTACATDSARAACSEASGLPISSLAGVGQETDYFISLKGTRQVDLVTMVDNSPSMAPKVTKMNAQFPKLIEALKDPLDGSLPDLRVAIIDSDLGTGCAYSSGSCGPKDPAGGLSCYGDQGRFQMLSSPTACTFSAGAQFLEYKAGASLNYTGDISSVFGCLASNLGSMGCGMEHQLQAFEFALAAKGVGTDAQQAAFLRGTAQLGLVFLSDEDDCSAVLNTGLFGEKPELRTESASLRCATRGHMCGGQNLSTSGPMYPTTAAYEHSFPDCMARTDTCPNQTDGDPDNTDATQPTSCAPLKNLRHLADEIKALKTDPDNQIVVAGIFGWPLGEPGSQQFKDNLAAAAYKIAPVPNPNTADTQHPKVFDYWPVCYDPDHPPTSPDSTTGFDSAAAGWGAMGGLRMSAFVDEFGEGGLKLSICERDFTNSMRLIGNTLARRLQNLCFDEKLVDTDPASPGIQAECRVVFRVPTPDPANPTRIVYQESKEALPQCLAGASNGNVAKDCWQLASDTAQCPRSGQVVTVLRTAAELSAKPQLDAGTKLQMQCVTCPQTAPALPGCDY